MKTKPAHHIPASLGKGFEQLSDLRYPNTAISQHTELRPRVLNNGGTLRLELSFSITNHYVKSSRPVHGSIVLTEQQAEELVMMIAPPSIISQLAMFKKLQPWLASIPKTVAAARAIEALVSNPPKFDCEG